jgi:hypothetical protein
VSEVLDRGSARRVLEPLGQRLVDNLGVHRLQSGTDVAARYASLTRLRGPGGRRVVDVIG